MAATAENIHPYDAGSTDAEELAATKEAYLQNATHLGAIAERQRRRGERATVISSLLSIASMGTFLVPGLQPLAPYAMVGALGGSLGTTFYGLRKSQQEAAVAAPIQREMQEQQLEMQALNTRVEVAKRMRRDRVAEQALMPDSATGVQMGVN